MSKICPIGCICDKIGAVAFTIARSCWDVMLILVKASPRLLCLEWCLFRLSVWLLCLMLNLDRQAWQAKTAQAHDVREDKNYLVQV